MIKTITLIASILLVGLLQADDDDNNSITFKFEDETVSVTQVALAQSSAVLSATDGTCYSGVTSKGQVTDGDESGDMQCLLDSDFTLSNNTLSLTSGRSDNKNIGDILTGLLEYGNAMDSYSNPFTATFDSNCQMTKIVNNPPQKLNFLFNVDMTFDVNNTTVTCSDITIAQQGINTPTVKGLYQTANNLESNGSATYKSGKNLYKDPKSTSKWKALGSSILPLGKDIEGTVKAAENIHNIWWILPGAANDGFTLQPYAGPRWLILTNENYKTAIECSDNHTLFITYSDNNSTADTFFMEILSHQ